MRHHCVVFAVAAPLLCLAQGTAAAFTPLRTIEDIRLPRADAGKDATTLEALQGDRTQRLTLVFFLSARCPCSNDYAERIRAIAEEYQPRGVRVVGVFSNQDETAEEIADYIREKRFGFPILRDPGARGADRFQAERTPQAFLLDAAGGLHYYGRIDDSQDPGAVRRRDLREALDALLEGRRPPAPTEAVGCGIVRADAPPESGDVHDEMRGMFGPWNASREASGTAWVPDASPMYARMGKIGPWQTMFHGTAYGVAAAPRDVAQRLSKSRESYSTSQFMFHAHRPLGEGETLGLRAMLSLDPLTLGRQGYPLPLQTGEMVRGNQLVDRQHPHDLFMEMAGAYARALGHDLTASLYLAPVGEPALGPPAFPHRPSAFDNPEAPLGHHWLDSTHITFGVATLGVASRRIKVEGSVFTGREPDEHRFNIDPLRFDSYSGRISWNPTPDLSFQASHGFLQNPERHEPGINQHRTRLSAILSRPVGNGSLQAMLAYGSNRRPVPYLLPVGSPGGPLGLRSRTTAGWLLETGLLRPGSTLFGRVERVEKDELIPNDPLHPRFTVWKYTVGGVWNVARGGDASGLGVGGSISAYSLPDTLRTLYRPDTITFSLFLRWRTED